MGSMWSFDTEPLGGEPVEMRLASREVCDDETWTNTVLNRSSCSVQQRLNMLLNELHVEERPRKRRPSIEFAPHDMVRVFEVQAQSDDVDSENSDTDEREHVVHLDIIHNSLLFDTDLW